MGNRRLSHLALSDDGFLFDASSGSTYTLNSSAVFILKGLIAGSGRDEIMAGLKRCYEAEEDVLARDLEQFCRHLRELDIVGDAPEG